VVLVLSRGEKKTLKRLGKDLSSSDQATRLTALEAIAVMFDAFEGAGEPAEPRLVLAILELTSDDDRKVGAKAAEALGAFEGLVPDIAKAPVTEQLLKMVSNHDFAILEGASWSLVRLQELLSLEEKASLLTKLLALTQDEDDRVVMTSLLSVAEIQFTVQAEPVVNRLLELTRDKRKEIRARAAKSLAWYKYWVPDHRRVELVESLLRLTHDAEGPVRESAFLALERGSEVGLTLFPSYAPIVVAIPPSHHRAVVNRFVELTRDESVFIQRGVTHALGNICNRLGELAEGKVVERLLELAISPDEHIRRNATISLAKLRELISPPTLDEVDGVIRKSRVAR